MEFKVPKSNPVVSEQVIVNIVYDDRTKTYTNNIIPRASSYTFPINTEVYAVRTKKYLGIQDYISKKRCACKTIIDQLIFFYPSSNRYH